ncbi:MAG TPA: alpha/beta fold hydrolase [Variovorax sp.]|nr:alpha/beta fold hydrolase [Variovorax sp.]
MRPACWGRVLVAALGLACASFGFAQTAWPAYMPQLLAGPSESPVAAQLPADAAPVPPDASVPAKRARWSGVWRGWACFARACEVQLAIEKMSEAGATVAYAGASSVQGLITDRAEGEFVGDELQVRLSTEAKLVLRLRESGDMEMSLWKPDSKLLSAGVLTQKPFRYERRLSRVPTPWAEDGKEQTLEMVSYRPIGAGAAPLPTLVFNHGSTGDGNKPEWFTHTWTSPEVAQYFVDKGWQVLMPQRRGRGKSDGLYDEGFEKDRSRYACRAELSLPGMERPVADLEAVMAHVKSMSTVDRRRMVIGGVSRGGILSVVYAGAHPDQFEGVINFVGGWVGDRCADAGRVNPALFRRGAAFGKPMLWLYGDKDPFYALTHSKQNFEAFVAAGGRGSFLSFDAPPGQIGHLIHQHPSLWGAAVDGYLRQVDIP